MTERELHLNILRAIKAYQDSHGGERIPFETLATELGMATDDLQKHLRALKNSDCVRYAQDEKTYAPTLVEIARNGVNRLKG